MTVRGGDKLQRKPRELLRTSVDLDGTVIEGELHFIRAGLKYAEVPGTPDVIRYVEGS